MAHTHENYYDAVRARLSEAFVLTSAPSRKMDGRDRAEVEYGDDARAMGDRMEIARSSDERCLIERARNSVRVSLKIKASDDLERMLTTTFGKFLGRRADAFEILRRVPCEGYDVSFLVLLKHTEEMEREQLVDFVVQFMRDIDSEISEQKLSVSSRGRTVASAYLKQFA